jgi:hypothetical protein
MSTPTSSLVGIDVGKDKLDAALFENPRHPLLPLQP